MATKLIFWFRLGVWRLGVVELRKGCSVVNFGASSAQKGLGWKGKDKGTGKGKPRPSPAPPASTSIPLHLHLYLHLHLHFHIQQQGEREREKRMREGRRERERESKEKANMVSCSQTKASYYRPKPLCTGGNAHHGLDLVAQEVFCMRPSRLADRAWSCLCLNRSLLAPWKCGGWEST